MTDTLLNDMRDARERAVVQKTALLTFRSFDPNTVVFVFEGVDDKIIYHKWIGRIRPGLRYEPLPCGNKKKVLELHRAVLRDKSGLSRGVYFFVDRDFDDLQGIAPHPSLFMTDHYSVENYLVNAEVVDEVLTNDFHCHGRPDIRAPLVASFQNALGGFVAVSRELNRRLFVARRSRMSVGSAPDKIKDFATVGIHEVAPGPKAASDLLVYTKELPAAELAQLGAQFDALVPLERYRGKYLKAFLDKWLELLAKDYAADQSACFSQLARHEKVKQSEHQLGGLASKSPLPSGLAAFVQAVQAI